MKKKKRHIIFILGMMCSRAAFSIECDGVFDPNAHSSHAGAEAAGLRFDPWTEKPVRVPILLETNPPPSPAQTWTRSTAEQWSKKSAELDWNILHFNPEAGDITVETNPQKHTVRTMLNISSLEPSRKALAALLGNGVAPSSGISAISIGNLGNDSYKIWKAENASGFMISPNSAHITLELQDGRRWSLESPEAKSFSLENNLSALTWSQLLKSSKAVLPKTSDSEGPKFFYVERGTREIKGIDVTNKKVFESPEANDQNLILIEASSYYKIPSFPSSLIKTAMMKKIPLKVLFSEDTQKARDISLNTPAIPLQSSWIVLDLGGHRVFLDDFMQHTQNARGGNFEDALSDLSQGKLATLFEIRRGIPLHQLGGNQQLVAKSRTASGHVNDAIAATFEESLGQTNEALARVQARVGQHDQTPDLKPYILKGDELKELEKTLVQLWESAAKIDINPTANSGLTRQKVPQTFSSAAGKYLLELPNQLLALSSNREAQPTGGFLSGMKRVLRMNPGESQDAKTPSKRVATIIRGMAELELEIHQKNESILESAQGIVDTAKRVEKMMEATKRAEALISKSLGNLSAAQVEDVWQHPLDEMQLTSLLKRVTTQLEGAKRRISGFRVAQQTLVSTHQANTAISSALNSQLAQLSDALSIASQMVGVEGIQFGGIENLKLGSDMTTDILQAFAKAAEQQGQLSDGLKKLANQNPKMIEDVAAGMDDVNENFKKLELPGSSG